MNALLVAALLTASSLGPQAPCGPTLFAACEPPVLSSTAAWLSAGAAQPLEMPALHRAPVIHAPAEDAWLGSDKFQHVLLSYAATAFTFAAFRSVDAKRDHALAGAAVVGGALGVGKEIRDRRRGSRFSVRDLVADALGIAGAIYLMGEVR